jgi:hypothetical protein
MMVFSSFLNFCSSHCPQAEWWKFSCKKGVSAVFLHSPSYLMKLTVLKNPPCNIIVTYTLHPCHFPTSTTAWIQHTISCSRQNTWPAEKQKEYNLRYLLAKVRTTWGK